MPGRLTIRKLISIRRLVTEEDAVQGEENDHRESAEDEKSGAPTPLRDHCQGKRRQRESSEFHPGNRYTAGKPVTTDK